MPPQNYWLEKSLRDKHLEEKGSKIWLMLIFFALPECTVEPRRYVCMVKVVRLLRHKYQLSCLLRHKLLVLKMTEQKVLQLKKLVLNLEVEDSLVNNSIPTTSRKYS